MLPEHRTGADGSLGMFGKHPFKDVVGFKDAVLAEKDVFAKAFTKHLLSYGLGRELIVSERVAVDEIVKASESNNYKLRDLIKHTAVHLVFSQKMKQ